MLSTLKFFDTTLINSHSKGFSGAVSDGRYLYLIPMSNSPNQFFGQITRYDLQHDFYDPNAWTVFDTAKINSASRGFADGLFDGHYLYLIPFRNDRHHGQVTRYDTKRDFHDPSAWEFFDIQKIIHTGCGFISGCSDGRYLYFAPYQLDWNVYHGTMVRYDTTRPFTAIDSWEIFNSELISKLSRGFHSAVVGKNFIYFVPFLREQRDYHGLLLAYRRNEPFTELASWETVDLKKFNSRGVGFIGGCYDGQYLYLAPYFDGAQRYGQIARYDTNQPLADNKSWQFFDTTQINSASCGFFGALIHQSFIYFIPHCKAPNIYHGQITRYDKSQAFNNFNAWSICDTSNYHPLSKGYIGGTIIGDYLYMAPYETAAGVHSGIVIQINLNEPTIWQKHEKNI